jgi:hypothetical protein
MRSNYIEHLVIKFSKELFVLPSVNDLQIIKQLNCSHFYGCLFPLQYLSLQSTNRCLKGLVVPLSPRFQTKATRLICGKPLCFDSASTLVRLGRFASSLTIRSGSLGIGAHYYIFTSRKGTVSFPVPDPSTPRQARGKQARGKPALWKFQKRDIADTLPPRPPRKKKNEDEELGRKPPSMNSGQATTTASPACRQAGHPQKTVRNFPSLSLFPEKPRRPNKVSRRNVGTQLFY